MKEAKAMLKKLALLFVIFSCFIVSCDKYEMMPPTSEGVLQEFPWRKHADGGELVHVTQMGNVNVGDSNRNRLYLIDTSIQNSDIEIEVLMADNLNMKIRLGCVYQVIPNAGMDLVLNYLGKVKKVGGHHWGYQVDLDDIFKINILPSFDLISRDIIGSYSAKDFDVNVIKDAIVLKLRKRLASIRRPKVSIDNMGKVSLNTGKDIAITDCIQIIAITIGERTNPQVVDNAITELAGAKAELEQKETELEQEEIIKQTAIVEAMHTTEANKKITENWNERLRLYLLQKMLIDEIPLAKNTKFVILSAEGNIILGAK